MPPLRSHSIQPGPAPWAQLSSTFHGESPAQGLPAAPQDTPSSPPQGLHSRCPLCLESRPQLCCCLLREVALVTHSSQCPAATPHPISQHGVPVALVFLLMCLWNRPHESPAGPRAGRSARARNLGGELHRLPRAPGSPAPGLSPPVPAREWQPACLAAVCHPELSQLMTFLLQDRNCGTCQKLWNVPETLERASNVSIFLAEGGRRAEISPGELTPESLAGLQAAGRIPRTPRPTGSDPAGGRPGAKHTSARMRTHIHAHPASQASHINISRNTTKRPPVYLERRPQTDRPAGRHRISAGRAGWMGTCHDIRKQVPNVS